MASIDDLFELARNDVTITELVENYENVDDECLPQWWRDAIEEFEEYGLVRYQPPRFQDGILKREVFRVIQSECDITLDVVGINVREGDSWTVRVNGEPVGDVERHRTTEGYTVYEMTAPEFVEWLANQCDESTSST
jgi:hypothetical protein